jgi:hypothetical protein
MRKLLATLATPFLIACSSETVEKGAEATVETGVRVTAKGAGKVIDIASDTANQRKVAEGVEKGAQAAFGLGKAVLKGAKKGIEKGLNDSTLTPPQP